jgi:hypothetical protein
VLKTAHEGDEVTKITKRETIEGSIQACRWGQSLIGDWCAIFGHLLT